MPPALFGFTGMRLLPSAEVSIDVFHGFLHLDQDLLLDKMLPAARQAAGVRDLLQIIREVDMHTAAAVCKYDQDPNKQERHVHKFAHAHR